MASAQPSIFELSAEEYVRRFEEAYDLHMPPYDFRVWKTYLFSKCSDVEQALGLFRLFNWPLTYLPGSRKESIATVGRWCLRGTFTDEVKNVIETAKLEHYDPEEVARDLAFIEKHQAIFTARPKELSEVGEKEQKMWLAQAKACVLSSSPNSASPVEINPPQWFAKQEAYFAFGVLAWNIRQDPGWVNQDHRLDAWYKLGYDIATQPKPAAELLSQYKKHFSFELVKFEYFLYYWSLGLLVQKLQAGFVSEHSIFWRNLTRFYNKGFSRRQVSVFRLYQVVSLMDDIYIHLVKTRKWGVFEQARESYLLDGYPDDEVRLAITRKNVYYQVLRHTEDPMALHRAMEGNNLREFIFTTYKNHNMQLSEQTLNIACCTY